MANPMVNRADARLHNQSVRLRSVLLTLVVGLACAPFALDAQGSLPKSGPDGEPPLVSIRQFLKEAGQWGETNRIRLRGTVTHVISDETFFIQSDDAAVYVFEKHDPPFRPGELVEVSGYPSLGGLVPTVQRSVSHVVGHAQLPTPANIFARQLTDPDMAMRLVRLDGSVVENGLMDGRQWVLRSMEGERSFRVNLEAVRTFQLADRPELGSVLQVTGILVVRASPQGDPAEGTILVRSMDDVKLLAAAPFWTVRRVNRTLAITAAALLATLVWVVTLRRQVKRQTRLVEQRFEREAALRALEDRFAKVFHASPDAVIISRADNDWVVEVNPAFERLSGWRRDEVVGQPESRFDLWSDPEARSTALRTLQTNGCLPSRECGVKTRAGTTVTCLCSAEWIELNGERCRLVVLRDITEQKRAAEAERALELHLQQAQKMESLGTLAGGIAHDFNNILAAILGNADLARMEPGLTENAELSLREIRTASLRGRDLVRRILSFSRQEALPSENTDLTPIVTEAAALLKAAIPASVEIETRLDPGCPHAFVDPVQFHQVVMNLGTNAWQAMEDKPGRVIISLQGVEVNGRLLSKNPNLKPGLHACLSVTDEGTGIPDELRSRIFEPFFTTKGVGRGTGLGLAAVDGIVRAHGGSVLVESRPGAGSTFSVFLPASTLPESKASAA